MWDLVLDVFGYTPTGNQHDPPSTSLSRAERLHPSGVRTKGRKTIYRNSFTLAAEVSLVAPGNGPGQINL